MNSIAIIIPYIGKLRPDFYFWMESVKANASIDFLLFTDAQVHNPPRNLIVRNTSFDELKQLIQRNFDFEICLKRPYKFCDFKPAYGEIFAKYLKDYDFWGYSDMDLVFGDIRKFVTDDLLNSYDHIFGRGHFSLYRNTPSVNAEYKNVATPNYKQVFTYNEGRAFDEYCGTSKHWADNLADRFIDSICFDDIDCMQPIFISQMRRKEYLGKKNFVYAFNEGSLKRIYEQNGKVYSEETLYVHFQKRDMAINTLPSNRFLIVPNSYEPFEEISSVERLKSLGTHKPFYFKRYQILWSQIKAKPYKMYLKAFPPMFGYPNLPDGIDKYYIEKL